VRADEGEGMTPEVLQRATEPFFTTKGPGTGLGLAMVHGFVQQSHGRLEIDSTPGQGTTVRMISRSTADGATTTRTDEAAPRGADDSGKARILVVEDNADVRELAESDAGHGGLRRVSAPAANRRWTCSRQASAVDLVFTDVIMPGGMNGLQLVDQVRARRPARRSSSRPATWTSCRNATGRGSISSQAVPAGGFAVAACARGLMPSSRRTRGSMLRIRNLTSRSL
jgi:CheY-like chemotaxis protein